MQQLGRMSPFATLWFQLGLPLPREIFDGANSSVVLGWSQRQGLSLDCLMAVGDGAAGSENAEPLVKTRSFLSTSRIQCRCTVLVDVRQVQDVFNV